MAGETVVETPQDNTKVDEPVKTDKEVIAEEEAAQAEVSRNWYFDICFERFSLFSLADAWHSQFSNFNALIFND